VGDAGQARHTPGKARIFDLAPTILHLCGVAVPGDMDDQVLTRAFTPSLHCLPGGRDQGSLQVEQETLEDEAYEEVIAERLRGLGISESDMEPSVPGEATQHPARDRRWQPTFRALRHRNFRLF